MNWLPEIRTLIPGALIDGPGWNRLLRRVGALPGEPDGSRCGFEFRLGEARAAADFTVVVAPGRALAEHYVRQAEAAPPDSPAAALGRFLVELGKPATAPRWVAGTLLEYDVVTAEPGHPAPGVFLRVRRASERGGRAQRCSPRELAATVARAVGRRQDRGEQQAVERVCAALPAGGEVAHVGAMPGRSPRAVRLVLHGVGHAQIAHLLERLEWAGSIRTAQAALADLRELLPRFWLSVDVSAGGVAPRLGLELFRAGQGDRQLEGWWTTGRGDWRPAVERLVERGWCLPAKARGLLAWCALDRVYDRRAVYLVYKGINHVKLTLEGDAVQAKAYAGAALSRLTDQRAAVESSPGRESAPP